METNKVRFKILFKETRKLLKITNVEKKQVYECMDSVIDALNQPMNDIKQVKKCSSFLSSFMHLLKIVVDDNKIIEDDDDELYSEKFSTLLSFYIASEVKRLKYNLEDQSRSNAEIVFIDKVVAKCRVYGDKNETLAVKSLGKFFIQNDPQSALDDDETRNKMKETFCKIFEKTVTLKPSSLTINSSLMSYYHQIFVVWLKIENDTDKREAIEKYVLEQNVKASENGRVKSQKKCRYSTSSNDIFINLSSDYFTLEDLPWLSNLDKVPFSADATVDLTIDSEDSDIEVELPPASEVLEIADDQEKSPKNPNINFPSSTSRFGENNRICIQERKTYINTITSLNDTQEPLSFSAFRRKSIIEDEERRKRSEMSRRKSCSATIAKRISARTKSVGARLWSQLRNVQDCHVSLLRVEMKDIEKLRMRKLKASSFVKKYRTIERSLKVPVKKNLKELNESHTAKKTSLPIKSSYPKRTQSNFEASTSSTKKSSQRAEVSECNGLSENFNILRPSEPVKKEKSKRIVNVDCEGIGDHQYAHSPWNSPLSTIEMIETKTLDVTNANVQIENFDISEIEQNDDLEVAMVNTDLLEELLGSRASNYLPDVHASMNSSRVSNLSRSSQSTESEVTPKKRKYTKRNEPKTIESIERPKRVRMKRENL